jgi:predicted nucleic acid-binding protein
MATCPFCGSAIDDAPNVRPCPECASPVVPRSPNAKVFLLDSNAYDPIVDSPDLERLVIAACAAGKIELLLTHVQQDELMDDETRRNRTLALPSVLVPTYGFVVNASKLGLAQLGEPENINAIRSPTGGHTHDALLASTAQHHGAILVTNDDRLRNFALRQGIEAWRSADFERYVRALGLEE